MEISQEAAEGTLLTYDSRQEERPLEATANGLFFIVGCGRSGTTLLQVMLDSHPRLALPNETHFFSDFYRLNRHMGDLSARDKYEQALDSVLKTEHFAPMGLDRQRVLELSQERSLSWQTLFLALLTAIREERGAPMIGEKTPAHISHLWSLYEWYPSARFIHLVRDPRAVVSSYLKAPFYRQFGKNLFHALNAWRTALNIHFDATPRIDPKRYMALRYEDLVRQPEIELRRITEFLQIDFDPRMLEFHKREKTGFLAGESHKLGTLKPVYQDSTEKWRKDLTPKQLALVESALGPLMEKMGYLESHTPQSPLQRLHMAQLFVRYKVRLRLRRLAKMLRLLPEEDLGEIAQAVTKDSAKG